jgi:GNAT superfamily N-acetyltransferase
MKRTPSWSLRKAEASDASFLQQVYASTRADEEPIKHWPPAHKERFLRLQYEAQDKHYRSTFPDAEHWIICAGRHEAGRLILNRGLNDIRIVDISLLPLFRRKGLGSEILHWVLGQAQSSRASVSLSVLCGNPALRLYQNIGFKECPGSKPPYRSLLKAFVP